MKGAKTVQVKTAELGTLKNYAYTVIFARHKDKWLFCRAKTRDVFETSGGTIEPPETPMENARRELFEETGAFKFDIKSAFDYSVIREGQESNGQVFYAVVHTLSQMPDYEMAEVGLFDTLPDKLRFPEITPVLFAHLQEWLHTQSLNTEKWDIYDENRNLTGRTHYRKDPIPQGDYNLVVLACLVNSNNEFLITKRAPGKTYAGMWEFPGGCAVAGDDSLTAVVREIEEEVGLIVKPEAGQLSMELKASTAFVDMWLFKHDFKLSDVVLQSGETVDAKLVSEAEIWKLRDEGVFHTGSYLEELLANIKALVCR